MIGKIKFDNFSPEALQIYEAFKARSGSEHIAKPITLEVLLRICREKKPKRILELGGGIGTISCLLLKHSDAFLDIYEDNEFCQNMLQETLKEFGARYEIVNDYRMLPPSREYDLVVVDGGGGKGGDGGFREAIWLYLNYLTLVKFVYVEGHRHIQRLLVRKALRKNYIYRLTRYADVESGGTRLNGGLLIECYKSKSRIIKFINFLFWELVEWTAVRNFIRYHFKI